MTRPAPSGGCDLQLVLFARACGGSGGRRGRGAALAPQLRRWCWLSAGRWGRRAPRTRFPLAATGPPPGRPFLPRFPAPGSPSDTRAAAAAEAPGTLSASGLRGGNGGELGPGSRGCSASNSVVPRIPRSRPGDAGLVQAAACGACRPEESEMPPPPPRSGGPGPAVQPSLPPPPVRGCSQPGASRACPPAGEWEGDGAPPPASTESAASPSTPVAGSRVRCAAEASPWTGVFSHFPG